MYERTGYHWKNVGQLLGDDPIPGSPDVVEAVAAAYRTSAGNLEQAVRNLRNLRSANETCSEAIDAIIAKADDVAGTLEQVRGRYTTIASALTTYAPQLREAQRMSIEAVVSADEAAGRRDRAWAANEEARYRSVTVDQQVRDAALRDYAKSQADYYRASADVADAKALLASAIAKRDAGGSAAQGTIQGVIQDSPLNDTVGDYLSAAWEKISKAVTDIAKWVWDHIDQIAAVLSLLAAVFPALAPLAALARLATFVKMGVALLRGIETGIKTGNWNDAIKAGITIGLTILTSQAGVIASKVGGKAATAAGRLVDKSNLELAQQTRGSVATILDQTLSNGVTYKQLRLIAAENRVLPGYHPGSAIADSLEHAANPIARESFGQINAVMSVMKGGDYAIVKPYVDQLGQLATKAPISAQVRATIVDGVNDVVSQATSQGIKQVAHYVAEHEDDWFPSPSAAQTESTCSEAYRKVEVAR